MSVIDFNNFGWAHPETGSLAALLTHNGTPTTEALLYGISGGAAFGYFAFHYEGHAPQINLLTRNTFDPLPRVLERLGIDQDARTTTSEKKAVKNLVEVLESGTPALAWADLTALPYSAIQHMDVPWMAPVVVYGLDGDTAYIADRADVPLVAPADVLTAARGAVKKERYRLMAPGALIADKLADAVTRGIWDCIKLYTETPPPGPNYKKVFGLEGIATFADYVTETKPRRSWAKTLKTDADRYAALTSAYYFLMIFGKHGSGAERHTYADFLDEAAAIIERPALAEVADLFRKAAADWNAVGEALLPDDQPFLAEAKALLKERDTLFRSGGADTVDARREINEKLDAKQAAAETEFPSDVVPALYEALGEALHAVHAAETDAVHALTEVMNG